MEGINLSIRLAPYLQWLWCCGQQFAHVSAAALPLARRALGLRLASLLPLVPLLPASDLFLNAASQSSMKAALG